jgi:nucleoside-diphosphate-sugar epimerase
LGSHLVDALVAAGDDVIIADNLSTGSLANVEDALRSGRATFVYLDVTSPITLIRDTIGLATRSCAIGRIFHFASPAGHAVHRAHPGEALRVTALGTLSLIDLAIERRARLIYASTSAVYGDPLVHPQPESYYGNVDPIGPRAGAEAPRFAEAAISAAAAGRDLDARIVRFFNCYGPRMSRSDGRLIGALADAAVAEAAFPIHGDGRQTRSMTFVDDAIELLLTVASAPGIGVAPINIGSDDERTVLEIAEAFARAAGTAFVVEHVEGRAGDPRRRRPDLTKLCALGDRPRTTLESGLAKTIAWKRDSTGAYV